MVNIVGSVARWIVTKAMATENSGNLASLLKFGNNGGDSGMNVNATSAMKTTAVYACVNVIAQTAAQLPFILYQRGGESRVRAIAHPLYPILHDAVSPWMSSFQFRETMTAIALLHGVAYAFVGRARIGAAGIVLQPMLPTALEVKQNKDYSLSYVFTDSSGTKIPLREDQVFRLAGLSLDGVTFVSPITNHAQSIGIALAADKHSALSFKHGAKVTGILKHPTRFKDADVAKRVRETWDEAFSGDNAFKTPLLEEGLDWSPISMTNRDAQFIESREFQIEDIARIFRVPPHKIGHLKRATNNNIEHQGAEFVIDTMLPWCRRWEQAVFMHLLAVDERKQFYAELLVDGLMRGDSGARSAYYASGIQNGWLSPNEARASENRDPYDGGDKYYIQANLVDTETGKLVGGNDGQSIQK